MKLSKKILTSALSGAMILQFLPMASAVKVPKLTVTRAGAAESEPLGPYNTNSLRLQMKGMVEKAEDCMALLAFVDGEEESGYEAVDRYFSGIIASFGYIFDDVFRPIVEYANESYELKSLNLKRNNFVPSFLKNPNMSFEEKANKLREFGRALGYKLKRNARIPKLMKEYAENNPKFFTDTSRCVSYYAGLLEGLHKDLVELTAVDDEDSQDESSASAPVDGERDVEEEVLSDSDSDSSSDSSGVEIDLNCDTQRFATKPGEPIDTRIPISEEAGKLESQDDSQEGSDEIAEEMVVHEDADNGDENPSAAEGNSESDKKSDNFMVRFLRFISFGLLFRE